ncbi:SMP-30/gluconolactonase/LRE family protein [Simiduia litorea]|uniref:SMP-30/gluconolactonase/LRE family protein n=1 Tax=Simiduia litorea TaxID=1435348 RepID=UPI0036F387FD
MLNFSSKHKVHPIVFALALLFTTSGCSTSTSSHTVKKLEQPNWNSLETLGEVEIIDPSAQSIIAADTKIYLLGSSFKWTEGPLWIDDEKGGYLLFSDIPNNRVIKYQAKQGISLYLDKTGANQLFPGDSPQGSNGLLLNRQGELVLLQQGNRRIVKMTAPLNTPNTDFTVLADRFDGKRLNSPNDAVVTKKGDIYFTDPAYGLLGGLDDPNKLLPFQGIYRLTPEGDLQLLDNTLTHPNGITLSANEQQLLVAVSDHEHPLWVIYDINANGQLENKRTFASPSQKNSAAALPGVPDGMATHSAGPIFATGPGGVWLFDETGKLLARIYTGKLTANVALSSDESVLYITAHDTLMALPLK